MAYRRAVGQVSRNCDGRRKISRKVVDKRTNRRRQSTARRENDVNDPDLCVPIGQDTNQSPRLQHGAADTIW
jgi:hypothetical protein